MSIIKKVLDETYNNNLLVEACKLYSGSELFIRELEVLAFFNNHVTFSFLNCFENCNQKDLLDILPNLYHDLINNSTDTLSKYKLTKQHLNTQEPDSKLSQKMLDFAELSLPLFTFCGNDEVTITIVSAKFPGLIKKFSYMTKKLGQKFNILITKRAFRVK